MMESDSNLVPDSTTEIDDDIRFVANRYRKDRFSVDQGWNRLGLGHSVKWIRMRIAAAIAALVVLSASAALIYHAYHLPSEQHSQQAPEIIEGPTAVVRVIDFEDAPLKDVVDKIEEVYGVEIQGLPENSDEYTLSMHYEGNVENLLKEINDILDIQLSIKQ